MNALHRFLQPKPIFALVIGVYALFGSLHLTQFVTADEHYWLYERVPKYWNAWGDWELRKTFINDKPGVTLALVTGPALLVLSDTSEHCVEQDNRLYDCQVEDTTPLLLAFRLPILIANGLILVYLFFLLSRLFGPWVALFASTFTALSPVLIGMTQIVNPDALLWSTSAAALFSYLAALKSGTRQDIVMTVLFTALALLSKYTALILFPTYALALFISFVAQPKDTPAPELVASLKTGVRRLAAIAAASAALVLALVPAFFLERKYLAEYLATVPDKEVLLFVFAPLALMLLGDVFLFRSRLLLFCRATVQRITPFLRLIALFALLLLLAVIAARYLYPGWSIYAIPFDIKDLTDARYHSSVPNVFEAFFLEWNAVLFSLPPILLASLALVAIFGLQKKPLAEVPTILLLTSFALSFTLMLIHSNILATARYAIMLFPVLALIGAFGLSEVARIGEARGKEWRPAIAVFAIAASVLSLGAIYPFYANYANALLPRQALIADAWGYGGYEAAQYLNALPDAKNLTVWSDYYGVCEFFVGQCLTAYTFDGNTIRPDYYVLTRRGEARYMSRFDRWERLSGLTAHRYYRQTAIPPLWSLAIDNRPGNYVKVFKVER
jgi:hypothetical protein